MTREGHDDVPGRDDAEEDAMTRRDEQVRVPPSREESETHNISDLRRCVKSGGEILFRDERVHRRMDLGALGKVPTDADLVWCVSRLGLNNCDYR